MLCVSLTNIRIGVVCIWLSGWLSRDRWRQQTDTRSTTFIQVIQVQTWLTALFCPHVLLLLAVELWSSACPSSFPSCQFWAFWWRWGPYSSSCPSSSFCLPLALSLPCPTNLERGKQEKRDVLHN